MHTNKKHLRKVLRAKAKAQKRIATTAPQSEPYPGYNRDLERHLSRAAAKGQSNAEPLPGALINAFGSEPLRADGYTIRPMVHFDFAILKRVDSPLIRRMQELEKPEAKRKEVKFTEEEGYEMIFQFITPIEEVDALVQSGRDAFRKAAMKKVGYVIPPGTIARLIELVIINLGRAFSTVVKFQAAEESKKKHTQPHPDLMTDSAGGSTTSAA